MLIEESIDIYKLIGEPASDEYADAVSNLALVYHELGRFDEARNSFYDALRLRRTLFDPPHEKIALSLHNLAWHHGRTSDTDLAVEYALEAVAMREAVYGEVHPRVAATVSLLSRLYLQQNRWIDAEQAARRSVGIAEQIFDSGHPDLTFPLYELASVLRDKGSLREANDLFRQIVEWERISLGSENHDLGMSIKAYAKTLADLGEYADAEKLLLEAHDIFVAMPGSLHGLEDVKTTLGGVYVATDRLEEAATVLGVGDNMLLEFNDTGTGTLLRRLEIVKLFLARDEHIEAESLIGDLRTIVTLARPQTAYLLPRLLSLQAMVRMESGRSREAIALLQQAIEIHEQRGHHQHWRVGVDRSLLGQAYFDIDDTSRARRQLTLAGKLLVGALGTEHPESRLAIDLLHQIDQAD